MIPIKKVEKIIKSKAFNKGKYINNMMHQETMTNLKILNTLHIAKKPVMICFIEKFNQKKLKGIFFLKIY